MICHIIYFPIFKIFSFILFVYGVYNTWRQIIMTSTPKIQKTTTLGFYIVSSAVMALYTGKSNTRIPFTLARHLDRTFSVSPSKSSIKRMAFSSSSLPNGFFSPDDPQKLLRIRQARIEQEELYEKYEVEADIMETWQRAIAETDRAWDILLAIPANAHQQSVVQSLTALQQYQWSMLVEQEFVVNNLLDRLDIVNKILDED